MKSTKLRNTSLALLFTLIFSVVSACSGVSDQAPAATNDQKASEETQVDAIKTTQDSSETPKSTEATSDASENKENDFDAEKQYKSLADLEFEGKQVLFLNDNHSTFSKSELSLEKNSWQTFSNLDSLNRVGVANAMLSKSLMPTEEREPLHVNPTGWKNKKIKVHGDTEWLYNRCHLIGFQLTGENNNLRNLMTGTRSLNTPYMLEYENEVADYLKSTGHHVRYQVEPIFRVDELVARGVHMQGKSVEDNEIDFNVYIFNIEEGVTINYADGSSKLNSKATNDTPATDKDSGSTDTASTTVSDNGLTVEPGGDASVSVKTKPNVQATIEVIYSSGPSHAKGLEPKTTDSNGNVSWTWTVGTRTKTGTYDVIITVNGETITKQLVVK